MSTAQSGSLVPPEADGTALHAMLLAGTATATGIVEAIAPARDLARGLNAFIPGDCGTQALAEAADARIKTGTPLALEGIPVSIKDNIALAGLPTTGASRALAAHALAEGAGVKRLREAGALFTDKTNLHELAFGITGESHVTGPARNPFDPARVAGGSSSGAAVAVAVGACAVALGTDTGGSCRIPAAHCGVVGFRPTTGRYPADGYLTLSPSPDTLGLLARSVRDVALVDGVLAADAAPIPAIDAGSLTLGFQCPQPIDPGVAQAFAAALDRLRDAGVTLVEIDLAEAQAIDNECGFLIAVYESTQSMAERARAYLDLAWPDFVTTIESPDVREVFASQLGDGAIPEAAYREAIAVKLPQLRAAFARVFEGVDAILYPTTAHTAPAIGDTAMTDLGGVQIPTFPAYTLTSRPDSMAGLPAISLPAGLANGLPTGLQVTGQPGSDRQLLGIAAAIEALLPARPVPQLTPEASDV